MVAAWRPRGLLGILLRMLRVALKDLRIGGITALAIGVVDQLVTISSMLRC
jgi:hypothetical protein